MRRQLFLPPTLKHARGWHEVLCIEVTKRLFQSGQAKNETAGTMTVEVKDESGGCRIEIPFGEETLNQRLTLAVPAGDILLATGELQGVSARNILRGQIISIEEKGNRTDVRVKSGVIWSVNVTRQAVNQLHLCVAQEVWLAIKTHSCYLLDE